ncbi:hypothetical protein IKG28_01850 [Candidatus Saccharibacteria bacterium]|nr:hypothetical protein [Candidatus Saccharibacteria bacterium]
MVKVFYGNDRIKAKTEIEKLLGKDYEIIEGAELTEQDLPSVFFGTSLFASTRNILIRDLSTNKAIFNRLPDYLNTPHNVIIFELSLDKRSAAYKELNKKVDFVEFKLPEIANFNVAFDVFRTAKTDGKKAVAMLDKIKTNEDPMMFFGLLASQAIKDYAKKQGTKEKRVLKELSKLDILLKTTSSQPWLLIESFLLQVSLLR